MVKSYTATFSSKRARHLIEYVALVAFAIVLFALWTWVKDAASKRVKVEVAGKYTVMDIGKLPQAHLLDVDSHQTVQITKEINGAKHLLIFLTAADCSSCLVQLGDWTTLAGVAPADRFEVDLLYVYTAPNELESFRRSYHLPYRIYLDADGEITKLIDIPPKTPVTVLVDSSLRVLAAQGPDQDDDSRRAFVQRVSALVDK